MSVSYNLQDILELACAAQRVNGSYVKNTEFIYDSNDQPVARKEPNRFLIDYSLGLQQHFDNPREPAKLYVTASDKELAEKIKLHFRKLMFSVIKGDENFESQLGSILNSETVKPNQFGYLACLPSVYFRDLKENEFKNKIKNCLNEYLGEVNDIAKDLDGDIVDVRRSNNFDAWNVCAIINNKLVTWFSKVELKLGPCVLIKGKVKEHRTHWKYKKSETRMNYVKVAQ